MAVVSGGEIRSKTEKRALGRARRLAQQSREAVVARLFDDSVTSPICGSGSGLGPGWLLRCQFCPPRDLAGDHPLLREHVLGIFKVKQQWGEILENSHCHPDHSPALWIKPTDPDHVVGRREPILVGVCPSGGDMHDVVGISDGLAVTDAVRGGVFHRWSDRKAKFLGFGPGYIGQHGKCRLLVSPFDGLKKRTHDHLCGFKIHGCGGFGTASRAARLTGQTQDTTAGDEREQPDRDSPQHSSLLRHRQIFVFIAANSSG
jgi:hypothetical protein